MIAVLSIAASSVFILFYFLKQITEQEIKSLGHEVQMQGLNDIQLTYPFIPTRLTNVFADPGTTCNLIYRLPIKGIEPSITLSIQRFIDHQLGILLLYCVWSNRCHVTKSRTLS